MLHLVNKSNLAYKIKQNQQLLNLIYSFIKEPILLHSVKSSFQLCVCHNSVYFNLHFKGIKKI